MKETIITCLFLISIFVTIPVLAQDNVWKKIEDETVDLFKRYIRTNTMNPPGDVTSAIEFYSGIFDREGIPYEVFWTDRENGKGNILAHLKGSGRKRPVMMLNHMDVVPVDMESWDVDPFDAVTKDGYIFGRGTLDMKNYGIVQMMSMVLLKRNGITLDRDLFFLAVCDEETSGELGAGWIARNKWDDIDAEYVLDEGGFGTQRFFTNDDRLIFSVGVAEKKVCWLKLDTYGTEGHGSMPPKENANFIMTRALGKVADYETPITINPVVREMINRLGPLADTPYNNALQRNTISLTVIQGYVGDPPKSNVIPDESHAVLDCRLLPETDPDEFIEELKQVINDDRVEINYIEAPKEAIVAPFDTDMFRAIEKETKEVFPESITLPHLIIYGTDSRFFRDKGAICYGFFPGPVTMDEYRRIHGNNERIRETSIRSAVKIYYNVMKSVCEGR
ncbi:MAG: M20/M25/M40 family metallo-hydrolase [bacterium]|nr:M20/M25/M40 family metallo-hydrolase [bacterium]